MNSARLSTGKSVARGLLVVVAVFSALALANGIVSIDPTGLILALYCGGLCLAVLGWGLFGAPLPPPFWAPIIAFPAGAVGAMALFNTTESHPLLWEGTFGTATTLAYATFVSVLCWRRVPDWITVTSGATRFWRKGDRIDLIFLAMMCGWAGFFPLLLMVNGARDMTQPEILRGVVARKYQTQGKGAANYLDLTGPAATYGSGWIPGEFSVRHDVYNQMQEGTAICLTLHQGLLTMRWWQIDDCPA